MSTSNDQMQSQEIFLLIRSKTAGQSAGVSRHIFKQFDIFLYNVFQPGTTTIRFFQLAQMGNKKLLIVFLASYFRCLKKYVFVV